MAMCSIQKDGNPNRHSVFYIPLKLDFKVRRGNISFKNTSTDQKYAVIGSCEARAFGQKN